MSPETLWRLLLAALLLVTVQALEEQDLGRLKRASKDRKAVDDTILLLKDVEKVDRDIKKADKTNDLGKTKFYLESAVKILQDMVDIENKLKKESLKVEEKNEYEVGKSIKKKMPYGLKGLKPSNAVRVRRWAFLRKVWRGVNAFMGNGGGYEE